MRNPFRRRKAPEQETRDIGPGNVSWPVQNLAEPASVGVDGALRLAPVFGAVRLLSSQVSSMPMERHRGRGNAREPLQLGWLREPSITGTSRDWMFRAMTSLALRGNAVGLVVERDRMEFPTRVEWLNPLDVHVEDSLMFGRGSFTDPIWTWMGNRIPTEDIVHIPWFTLPGRVWGLSPIGAYAMTVSTGLAAQRYSDDWFKSGGVPPGTFRNANQKVDQQDAATIKQRLVQSIRSHEPIVYGNDWEYSPISISPQDAQFIETMKMTAGHIATIYGIPPEKLGGESGGSMEYTNVEAEGVHFLQFTLLPWLVLIEQALSNLLPRGQYVKFNADSLTRTDAQTRYTNYERARKIGLLSLNEIRAMEDLPPLPGDQGNDYTPLKINSTNQPNERGRSHLRVVEEGEG